MLDFVLDQSEHVSRCLAQVVIGADLRKRHLMRKPIYSERIADSIKRAWNVALVAPVVLSGGSNVPTVDSMRCHVGSLLWRHVNDHSSAWWGERSSVEIKISIEAGVGREPMLATRGSKKIQSYFGLGKEEAHSVRERKLGIAGGEAGAEVVHQVWIARSAALRRWLWGGTRWKST